MINSVKNFLKKYNLSDSEKTFIVGFSGGYDSMCLLDILNRISQKTAFRLAALHLNHNWRAVEAKIEEENCRNYCKNNNIEFYSETLPCDVPKTETAAREARLVFFKKYYKKLNADGLFLAHTKSDNTETILYRIIKGTGMKGLCGILESSAICAMNIFRPLMLFSREDILKYCQVNKLSPNNDSSNFDTKYARNFIRHQIVSSLKSINPDIDDTIYNLSKISVSEQKIIQEYLEKLKKEIQCKDSVLTQKFIGLSKDVQCRLILNFLIEQNIDYDSKKVMEIHEFINKNARFKAGKTLSLTTNLWLFVSKEKICTIDNSCPDKNTNEILVKKCGEYDFCGKVFKITEYKGEKSPEYPKETENYAYVKPDKDFSLTLRTRREGDFIRPFGMKGSMKLKKYFINKGVDKFKRNDIILLCKGSEVLWAQGIGLSESLRAVCTPTHIIKMEDG